MNKLTVVIPTRNEKPENLLRAVSFKDPRIEYLIYFDHSEEEFAKIEDWVAENLETQMDVFVEYGEIRGLIDIQNDGLEWADEYFMYLHGHDYLGEGVLALMKYLDENPDASYAYGTLQYRGMFTDKVYPIQYDGEELYKWDFPRNAVCYRAVDVMSVGGFRKIHNRDDVAGNEEHVLNLDLHEAGYRGYAVKTEEPALYFEIHRGGLTETVARNVDFCNDAFRKAFPKYTGTLINPKIFD